MSVTVYGLKNCDTCRKSRKWLEAQGIEYRFVDYRDAPVDAATLKHWAAQVGGWDKLVNRRSATWRALSAHEREAEGDRQWSTLVAAHPTLVRRPVLVRDGSVHLGFGEREWAGYLGA